MRIQSQKQLENDFIDNCIIWSLQGLGSIEELIEMPASRWIIISERLERIERKLKNMRKRKR